MDRLYVIQTLIKRWKFKNYLEIGVFTGHVFFRVPGYSKVAVDPDFAFGPARKLGKSLMNPGNFFNRYFQKSSDEFFSRDAPLMYAKKPLDIALVDGMHEYSYALRDIENSLRFLSADGVVIVHDCNPTQAEHACSFEEYQAREYSGIWNGDVWKAILYLRSQRNDLRVMVLDCDHGIGIIRKGESDEKLPYTPEEIAAFTFDDLHRNREKDRKSTRLN